MNFNEELDKLEEQYNVLIFEVVQSDMAPIIKIKFCDNHDIFMKIPRIDILDTPELIVETLEKEINDYLPVIRKKKLERIIYEI